MSTIRVGGIRRRGDRPGPAPGVDGEPHLANRLGEAGRRAEALTAAQEAATHYDELARSEPDVFGADAERVAGLVDDLSDRKR